MNCLWCDDAITLKISWDNIIALSKPERLCEKCLKTLEILSDQQCPKCGRESKIGLCIDCKKWSADGKEDPLVSNVSVFSYNEQMQSMIAKWKYRGDYILAEAFKSLFVEVFKKNFPNVRENMVIIPIPLSKERLKERGFNQAKALADLLPIESIEGMTRIHNEKQSKKSRYERISTENPFKVHININKPAILVDDIYTTGTTLRHAATVLKACGCPKVYAYTLIRG